MTNFWNNLPKPFFVQAPMEKVTDTVFRQILARCGRPDVFFTEFTSTDGLCSKKGKTRVARRLQFTDIERPIVAQIWGNKPENYRKSIAIIKEMGFDGIDINMGCPVGKVIKRGECSGLICNPDLVSEIITTALKSAGDMPVSVKTRIGFKTIETDSWVRHLLQFPLSALTLHGRTAHEMSKVPAHWDEIEKAVKIRNELKSKTLIIGNGDVRTHAEGVKKVQTYGVDGIMIGRGFFENLWIFNQDYQPTPQKSIQMFVEHLRLFDNTWGKTKDFNALKKFFKVYIHKLPNAKELRNKLMRETSSEGVLKILESLSAP